MNIFNNDIDHFSIGEIRAYLDNQMSNKERHDFEHHLLGCDLCNDAFEGYQTSGISFENDTKQQLEVILARRTSTKRSPKMAIAASVVILLCASIVFVFSYFDYDSTEVTLVEKEQKNPSMTPLVSEDSVQTLKNETMDKAPEKARKVVKPIPRSEPVIVEPENIKEEELVNENSDHVEVEKDDSFLEEIVTDDIVFTDEEKPDVAFETESSEVPTAKTRLKKQVFSRRSLAAPLSIENSESKLTVQNAVPIMGIDSYKLYLKDSLRYPESAKEKELQGQVELRFRVNDQGEVIDLEVVNELSEECDLEAKRLVLEGSKWVLIDKNLPVDQNVVNLTIEFTLE